MKNIEIYTSNTCAYCGLAKDFFKERNLQYIELNISKDILARKKLMKMGYMSVPVIVIDGQEIVGFDQQKVEEILNK